MMMIITTGMGQKKKRCEKDNMRSLTEFEIIFEGFYFFTVEIFMQF